MLKTILKVYSEIALLNHQTHPSTASSSSLYNFLTWNLGNWDPTPKFYSIAHAMKTPCYISRHHLSTIIEREAG